MILLPYVLSWMFYVCILLTKAPPFVMHLNHHNFVEDYPPFASAGLLIAGFGAVMHAVTSRFYASGVRASRLKFQVSLRSVVWSLAVCLILLELFRQRDGGKAPAALYAAASVLLFLSLLTRMPASRNRRLRLSGLSLIVASTALLWFLQFSGTALVVRPRSEIQEPDRREKVRQLVPPIAAGFLLALVGSFIRAGEFIKDPSAAPS